MKNVTITLSAADSMLLADVLREAHWSGMNIGDIRSSIEKQIEEALGDS